MKRTLVLIRHAKSSWSNPLQSDFERPLNSRGEQDAPMMGSHLKKLSLIPDLIISSTATRAINTAKKIAEAIGYNQDEIRQEDHLYHCIPQVFEEIITELPETIKTVFIVAHNPGITAFTNELSAKFKIDNMPTCSVVAATINADRWSDFNMVEKQVFLFEYPRKFYDSK